MAYQDFIQQDQQFQTSTANSGGGETETGGFIEDTPAKGPVPDQSGPFTGPAGPNTPGGEPVGWQGQKPEYLPNQPEFMPSASEWTVDENQLVESRMNDLMQKDSDLFKSIEGRARREHAVRGGQNSLMATMGAETAVADQAFQIASQDAQTFARSAEFNAAMKNQFGQAEQRFMHNAMLSEQNFRQARLIQREQLASQRAAAAAATNRAMKLADKEQEHWRERNETVHGQTLEIMDLEHGYNQEMSFQNYEQQWLLGEQGQAHSLEQMDRQTDNQIRAAEQQFGWTMTLNYQSELAALERQRLQGAAMIGSTEGLSAEQQRRAYEEQNEMFANAYDLTSSFYASQGGPGFQARWYSEPGGDQPFEPGDGVGTKELGGGQPRKGEGGEQGPWRNPYEGRYGDYLSYGHGGYNLYMPPKPSSMGGQPGQGMQMVGGSMYGSNPEYGNQGYAYTQPWFNPPQGGGEEEGGGTAPPGGGPGGPPTGGGGGRGTAPRNSFWPPTHRQ